VNDCRNNALPDYAFIEPPYVDQDERHAGPDHHPDSFVSRVIGSFERVRGDPLVRRGVALDAVS